MWLLISVKVGCTQLIIIRLLLVLRMKQVSGFQSVTSRNSPKGIYTCMCSPTSFSSMHSSAYILVLPKPKASGMAGLTTNTVYKRESRSREKSNKKMTRKKYDCQEQRAVYQRKRAEKDSTYLVESPHPTNWKERAREWHQHQLWRKNHVVFMVSGVVLMGRMWRMLTLVPHLLRWHYEECISDVLFVFWVWQVLKYYPPIVIW